MIRDVLRSLEADFVRLDSKYGKDWTEWQDVRDDLCALNIEAAKLIESLGTLIVNARILKKCDDYDGCDICIAEKVLGIRQ